MLYKKIHRQYLREWRIGRKFDIINGNVYEVTKEPYIGEYYINVLIGNKNQRLYLIFKTGKYSGQLLQNKITWID